MITIATPAGHSLRKRLRGDVDIDMIEMYSQWESISSPLTLIIFPLEVSLNVL